MGGPNCLKSRHKNVPTLALSEIVTSRFWGSIVIIWLFQTSFYKNMPKLFHGIQKLVFWMPIEWQINMHTINVQDQNKWRFGFQLHLLNLNYFMYKKWSRFFQILDTLSFGMSKIPTSSVFRHLPYTQCWKTRYIQYVAVFNWFNKYDTHRWVDQCSISRVDCIICYVIRLSRQHSFLSFLPILLFCNVVSVQKQDVQNQYAGLDRFIFIYLFIY